jgi:hypothetical protein
MKPHELIEEAAAECYETVKRLRGFVAMLNKLSSDIEGDMRALTDLIEKCENLLYPTPASKDEFSLAKAEAELRMELEA